MLLERPHEEDLHDEKIKRNKDVDDAINYLKKIFWHYANNERKYNYTQDEFRKQVGDPHANSS